jgi:putative Mg2+ transporter-C (MgtC) family protein
MDFSIDLTMTVKLLMSALLGGLIGLEREVHGRPAGFRTHLLVSLGACLFVLTSLHLYQLFGSKAGSGPVGVDPGRIAAQVVAGIGFLGAGAIIRERASIRGLTTAACLWVAAALGVACGVGMFVVAMLVTAVALLSLLLLKKVETLLSRDTYTSVMIWSMDCEGQVNLIENALKNFHAEIVRLTIERDVSVSDIYLEYYVKYSSRDLATGLVETISSLKGVRKVRLE